MKILRWLVTLPTILILGLLFLIMIAPTWLYLGAIRLYSVILKLICWATGYHKYDIYSALVTPTSEVHCNYCKAPIPEKDIASVDEQKKALTDHIKKMAQHLQTTKEDTEISGELSKLA